jgi:mono/diheme cytochrome c family protein
MNHRCPGGSRPGGLYRAKTACTISAREVPMRILAAIGILAIIIAVGAAVFFFGGFYSVAASEPDPGIVNWALVKVRTASIDHHAHFTSPVNLDDPEIVRAGARAFSERGCANCHGAPGVNWQKFSEGLNPDPPDLKEIAHELEPAQLFWVVKNGIKMTGMPSFGAIGANDNEIWSIVAFVRKVPNVSEDDFKAWTAKP